MLIRGQVRHLEAIMRIAESFCKMRLSDFCSNQDIDRAIAVTVDSFVGSQKVSAKKALARAFAKYTLRRPERAKPANGVAGGAGGSRARNALDAAAARGGARAVAARG